jgi:DNA (cytosine-5)-methyltransferase 1
MPHNTESGRIVIDIGPVLKRELYAALSLSGSTLKDWFTEHAVDFCATALSRRSSLPSVDRFKNSLPGIQVLGKNLSKKRTIVSLFSGCGGMDLGFLGGFKFLGKQYARLPFEIVWANDANEAACKTYMENLGKDIVCADVWKVLDTLPAKADILIGGFPCQDISVNGKRKGVNGTRSGLYRAMVEAIKKVKPSVFVAENVKGLLMESSKDALGQILTDFGSLGYSVGYQLYQAANYGVPQTRERVLIVGTDTSAKPFIPPKVERSPSDWVSAKEAIGELEKIEESPEMNHIWSRAGKSPGQGNRRLQASRAGYTIRAECHGNIQWHYKLNRRISMREAARIQSFPDDFIFHAKLRETERMLGNAVPPVLAWHVAKAVLACFD